MQGQNACVATSLRIMRAYRISKKYNVSLDVWKFITLEVICVDFNVNGARRTLSEHQVKQYNRRNIKEKG